MKRNKPYTTGEWISEVLRKNPLNKKLFNYDKAKYVDAYTKIIIHCNTCGNDFDQLPFNHMKGTGCRFCRTNKSVAAIKKTNEQFLKELEIKFDDKIIPLEEYTGSDDKILVYCNVCGNIYKTTPQVLLKVCGCPECAKKKISKARAKSPELFIQEAKSIHGDKYDYSETDYTGSFNEIKIKCNTCGEVFWQKPVKHLLGHGCPKCRYVKVANALKADQEEVIERFKKWYGNRFDYSKVVYKNMDTPVTIICPIHGEFQQTPYNHLKGCNCPDCNETLGELKIKDFLENHKFVKNETYFREYKFDDLRSGKGGNDYLRFDFYIPSKNLLIEFQGKQHYESVECWGGEKAFEERLKCDQIKRLWCNSNGLKLLEINYDDYSDIDKILEDAIIKQKEIHINGRNK